jgi:serine/threonine protein kinase
MPILTPEERVGATMAGKYRLDRIVATGGMATVYAGMHAWTERAVAVKILNYEHARDPEVVRRFLQEARAAAQLKHTNVVDVLDMGEDQDGTVYLVLELLSGETLKARLRRGILSLREVGSLLLPVMRAVASAHAKGVVHRDLKPDNIFIATDEHGMLVPKLLDFGIAKVAHGDSSSTRTGLMVGTPQFMSPEQVRGERHVGPPADVWSMGVVLHAALSGRVPFEAESTAGVLAKVITERAKPFASLVPTIRPEVAAVIDRSLVNEVEGRFANMGEMVAALEAALDGPSASPSVGPVASLPASVAAPLPALPALGGSLPIANTPTQQLPYLDAQTQAGAPAFPSQPPSSGELPATTPFAWTAEPAPPSRSGRGRSALPLVLGAGLVLALVAVGAFVATRPAEPVRTTFGVSPLPPALPVVAPPSDPVIPTALPIAEVPPADVIPAEVPNVPSAEVPVAGTAPAPSTEPVPEAVVSVVGPAPVTEVDAGRAAVSTDERPRRRADPDAPRTPRRGTGGAFILH